MIENEVIITAIKDTVTEVLLIFGGASVVLVGLITGLITWGGKIWMNKMIENDRRKTQFLIEELKNSLTQEREKYNQVLKTQLDQSRFLFEKTIAFVSDNQKFVGEKRLLAFEKLWKTIPELKRFAPFYLDYILSNEQELLRTNPKLKSIIDGIKEQEFIDEAQKISAEFEYLRIYIPETIWQMYSSYKILSIGIPLRLKFFLNSNNPLIPWYREQANQNIIINIMSKEEVQEFNSKQVGQLSYTLDLIESKILELIQMYISGDIALEEIIEKTNLLGKANQKAEEIVNETSKQSLVENRN
jgi:hypothetical protein